MRDEPAIHDLFNLIMVGDYLGVDKRILSFLLTRVIDNSDYLEFPGVRHKIGDLLNGVIDLSTWTLDLHTLT